MRHIAIPENPNPYVARGGVLDDSHKEDSAREWPRRLHRDRSQSTSRPQELAIRGRKEVWGWKGGRRGMAVLGQTG